MEHNHLIRLQEVEIPPQTKLQLTKIRPQEIIRHQVNKTKLQITAPKDLVITQPLKLLIHPIIMAQVKLLKVF